MLPVTRTIIIKSCCISPHHCQPILLLNTFKEMSIWFSQSTLNLNTHHMYVIKYTIQPEVGESQKIIQVNTIQIKVYW